MGHKGPVLRPRFLRPGRVQTLILFYSSFIVSSNMSRQHSPTGMQLLVHLCYLSCEQGALWLHTFIIWAPYFRLGCRSSEKGPLNPYFLVPYKGIKAKVMWKLQDSYTWVGRILLSCLNKYNRT